MNPNFLHRAVELSRIGMDAGQGGPFGAVIVRSDRIIAEAYNTVVATKDPTNHAEMVAIRIASHQLNTPDLSDCELYTSAEPCPMCVGAIYWAGIAQVHYSNTREDSARIGFADSLIFAEVSTAPDQRDIPFAHHPDEKARSVFRDWLNKDDRVQY